MSDQLSGPEVSVWLPAIRAGSGSDVFVKRLADGLNGHGVKAIVTWFPHWMEVCPDLLRSVPPPLGINIIHANAAQAFAFKRDRIPLVATELHYILDPAYRPFKSGAQQLYHQILIGRYLRRSFAAASAVTAISDFTAGVLRDNCGLGEVTTIPLWVDLNRYRPTAKFNTKPDPFRLLFVGNASRRKGADIIPELAARLGSRFEILCTAGLRQQMRERMPDNVRILGQLDEEDLVKQYQDCGAVLVPSRYEGFGYAALEGMACAKPVVGFRSEAVAEVVGAEGAPLLSEIDDIDGLARLCQQLASNPGQCEEFGLRGRQRAETAFPKQASIAAYVALYRKLIRVNPANGSPICVLE